MTVAPDDLHDEWSGLEPEQPRPSRAAFWLALLASVLLLLGICSLGSFALRIQTETATPEPPIVQTTPTTVAVETAGLPGLAATVTLPAQSTALPEQLGGSDVMAIRMESPPRIDADGSDWPATQVYRSAYQVYAAPDWDGTDDLTADWQLGWDSDNLYVLVSVVDDTHVQTQIGNRIFRGDSVEMQFDTDRPGDFGPELSPDDIQINLSPGDFTGVPPVAYRFQGTADGGTRDMPDGLGVSLAARQTGTGYLLEAAIPWTDLDISPTGGLLLGLALNASDNDRPGTAVQEVLKSHVASRRFADPTSWGTLTLAE